MRPLNRKSERIPRPAVRAGLRGASIFQNHRYIVIASPAHRGAKQSLTACNQWDCFVAKAPRNDWQVVVQRSLLAVSS